MTITESRDIMRAALIFLNLLVSLVSAAWAVAALIRPASLSGSGHISSGENFYARMYAARSIPFGLAAAITPFCVGGKVVSWLLFTAAVIQVADVVIGVEKKKRGMIIGGSLGAIIHILCGLAVL